MISLFKVYYIDALRFEPFCEFFPSRIELGPAHLVSFNVEFELNQMIDFTFRKLIESLDGGSLVRYVTNLGILCILHDILLHSCPYFIINVRT